jgi:hypothetical protein
VAYLLKKIKKSLTFSVFRKGTGLRNYFDGKSVSVVLKLVDQTTCRKRKYEEEE